MGCTSLWPVSARVCAASEPEQQNFSELFLSLHEFNPIHGYAADMSAHEAIHLRSALSLSAVVMSTCNNVAAEQTTDTFDADVPH